ncbi:methionyl-tRNA formyltransferase [Acidaminobacter sp. JC074]|uniref:methionyl-tRNA formyltransferase n=1 Tax=Acidaminobacter sp. JC074 TaxID=2530199 RepID=UPI001F10778F|nr:methionyl-tRNA formyltransferase [Acidaminobacter sp. JC074]MCH4890259.1 methionyl-tRNA formyltransferase [Acidaminobacter sp. JC074]
MKIVFMGTPEFAVPCLDILDKNFEVQAVFTQPDRPKGRGKKMAMSAVKERALESQIPVYQPEKIKKSEDIQVLKDLSPDVIVVVAYGQLLSQEILDIPKFGCINVHASLLPRLRGAAPLNFAIVNGEKVSGVTTQYMVRKLDEGDMIDKIEVEITEDMTAGELHDILSLKGGDLIMKTVSDIEAGHIHRTPQDHELSTYAPKMDKEMAVINWSKPAQEIHNLIRGFNPWPIATTKYLGGKVKVFKSSVLDEEASSPGKIIRVSSDGLVVDCLDKRLLIKEIQMPNKKRMTVAAYILGNSFEIGTRLGE